MLLASKSQNLILLIDTLTTGCDSHQREIWHPACQNRPFLVKNIKLSCKASNVPVAIHLCHDDTHLEPAIFLGMALSFFSCSMVNCMDVSYWFTAAETVSSPRCHRYSRLLLTSLMPISLKNCRNWIRAAKYKKSSVLPPSLVNLFSLYFKHSCVFPRIACAGHLI